MLQIFQLEVDVCFYKPAVIWGIIEDGFSYVGPNPFFGNNDFFGDIHKAFSDSRVLIYAAGPATFAFFIF